MAGRSRALLATYGQSCCGECFLIELLVPWSLLG